MSFLQSFLSSLSFGDNTITATHPSIPGLSVTAPVTGNTENEVEGALATLSLILGMFHHASTTAATPAK